MKITNNTLIHANSYYKNEKPKSKSVNKSYSADRSYDSVKFSQIAFGAIYNVKPKKLSIDFEKNKLLRQIADILETDSADIDLEDLVAGAFKKAMSYVKTRLNKQNAILKEMQELADDKILKPQQKISKANELKKEFKMLENNKLPKKTSQKPSVKQDERIDYQLLNKFRSAISEDDFNLQKVFHNYYSGLNEISSVEDLGKKYPKIKVPPRPEEVIAKKIESTFTRDFYEEFDEMFESGEKENIFYLSDNKIRGTVTSIAEKFKTDAGALYDRVSSATHNAIINRYAKAKLGNAFSSIPEQRKIKMPPVTDVDLKLLYVDFDDFVLSVFKKQYLESKNLNEIIYSDGDVSVPLKTIKDSDYKFDKIPEKIRGMIGLSEKIKAAQRDYENFNHDELRNRLNFYANSELANNEAILEHIISFDSCKFGKDDVDSLIRFLRELDSVHDGKKSLEKGIETICKENIRPIETERLNEIDRKKIAEKIKLEQKKVFELNELKSTFDESINFLYENNMNNLANTCLKYRPNSLDSAEVKNSNFIVETIAKNIKSGKDNSVNKSAIESKIMRWDTYNDYKNNESDNPILKNAINYAKGSNGEVNPDKAGQYIINSEVVENYPESSEYFRYPEILSKVMDRVGEDNDAAIKYLCKFDDYMDLNQAEKTYLSKFISIFNPKDSVDKVILKHIIENDYAKCDTTVLTNVHESSGEPISATISAKAKQQIMDKYKYPICIEYLNDFEEALSSFASARGTSGIKYTGRNNKALEYKMELKLYNHDDRLFSSENNYYFDIFSNRGLH